MSETRRPSWYVTADRHDGRGMRPFEVFHGSHAEAQQYRQRVAGFYGWSVELQRRED